MTQRDHDLVLVVDFGAQYAQLIARRVREAKVYSEIVPHTASAADILARRPKAIILSGGPSSVYEPGAPLLDAALVDSGTPVLGICYGFMAMAQVLGGSVARTGMREYGRTAVSVTDPSTLLAGLPPTVSAWMSHGDEVIAPPDGSRVIATSARAAVAAFEDTDRRLAGVQWHPEVLHTERGQQVLENFLFTIAGCTPDWTPANIIDESVLAIQHQVGGKHIICGLSGGVDSAVAAALVQRAVGSQLTCVFVDHGLLRKGEAEQVERDYVAATGVDLKVVDASVQFLSALSGVTDPEQKRKIIGRDSFGPSRRLLARWSVRPGRSSSWCRARSIPTSSSQVAVKVRPTSRVTTMSAACPKICSSSLLSPCAYHSSTAAGRRCQGVRGVPKQGRRRDQDHAQAVGISRITSRGIAGSQAIE